ncbi:LOW QUALITY PROTEIN: uncharacterized protein LOC113775218 [Coffea eugenioides]|uniref:LOW QUALITY PROTEIN: uncharacterized protein LOC113775218 n=1 Tax=Coffea eugenioides TaxID=49369 RepID=UPI000F608D26|nr:LOW QUALITY PROTEIN: uncharacterized protein LOC113775218 [Coffea eugenioides]
MISNWLMHFDVSYLSFRASSCRRAYWTGSSRFNLENSVVPNGMKGHMEEIILHRLCMPEKMLLNLSHPRLHFKILCLRYGQRISFKLGMSFSARITENALQFRTSKNGGTKLSDIITGTHS